MLQAHFARVSTHEGAFLCSLNLLRELAPKYLTGYISWSILWGGNSEILLPRMKYTHEIVLHTEELSSRSKIPRVYRPLLMSAIGNLQLAIRVVQNRRAGKQKSHWDKTNKRHLGLLVEVFHMNSNQAAHETRHIRPADQPAQLPGS